MINQLGIQKSQTILDYGCAKGFTVKAFRIFDFEAYGVDISDYAIKNTDSAVREYCCLIKSGTDSKIFERYYDWMISKDVFEHMQESELKALLGNALLYVDRVFAVVPVAIDDFNEKYIIPDYDRDVTHVIVKSSEWWRAFFLSCGWKVEKVTSTFTGCKENWTSRWENGNSFFVLSSPK